uniref:Sulfate_transp domain-containing protein n=1 Tax=Syphacia muris TaxID=451379 RepID=A0A0N5AFZ4_9BILA
MQDGSGKFRIRQISKFQRLLNGCRTKCTFQNSVSSISRFIPIVGWLPKYNWQNSFFGDLSGGLSMAVFTVPQAIAQAAVTGVDPVYGLYTAIFPSFLYVFFGTSKHISLGGFAVLSLMTHAAIENVMVLQAKNYNQTQYINHSIAEFGNITEFGYNQNWFDNETINEVEVTERWTYSYMPVKPIQVATTITFLCGIIQLVLGICQLEFLTNYFSDQVISGFVIGGCVHVFFAQIGDLLGIRLQRRTGPGYLYYRLKDLIMQLHEIQIPTVAISTSSIAFLIFSKVVLAPWLSKVFMIPIPYELILAIVATTATNFADLSGRYSISVVGNIPTKFPLPSLPRFDFITSIAQQSLGIAEIALAVHVTVAKIVESRYEYGIPCSQELRALGMAGLTSSFFPVFPVTAGFARSVVGTAAGGSTQMTSFFCALSLLSVILYIGPALEYLPKCVLASMVVVSMKVYFEKFAELKKLWPVFKIDFIIWIVSMLLTICFDMAGGLAIAALFALLTTLFRNQRPKWHYLSRNDKGHYQETKKKEIKYVNSETCIFRMDGPLIFTSVDRFITVCNYITHQLLPEFFSWIYHFFKF